MSEPASLHGGAARRAQNYFFLSRIVHEPPSEGLLAEIGALPVPAEGSSALSRDFADLRRIAVDVANDPEKLTALAVEFTRLFSGLSERGGAPPIESVVRENRLLGDAGAAVAMAYAEGGFPEPLPTAGPPDHLAAELRFLALCCYEEAEAWKRANRAAALAWLERERSFLENHVAAWVPSYCTDVAKRAHSPYYVIVARLIAGTCLLDRDGVAATMLEASHLPNQS